MLRRSTGRWIYRSLFAALLAFACLYQGYAGLFQPRPMLTSRWKNGVCLQSSEASCSAAAAATLLTLHGIAATEEEMAGLCLTTDAGTSLQGVYRGLRIKTAGTKWRVAPIAGGFDRLHDEDTPALLSVGLGRWQSADVRYSRDWGWAPGTLHSVVLMGFVMNEKVNIADPKVGREQWLVQGLTVLWKGEGLRLVER